MNKRLPPLRGWAERNALAEQNLPLVPFVVKHLFGGRRLGPDEMADACQDGYLGLLRAAELWDDTAGITFGTYAFYWIKQTVLRGRAEDDLILVPQYHRGPIREALRARLRAVRLDCPGGSEDGWGRNRDGKTTVATLPAPEPVPPPTRYDLSRVLACCRTSRQREVIRARIRGEPDGEIARRLGMTRSRVHQIRQEAFAAVRAAAEAGDYFELD